MDHLKKIVYGLIGEGDVEGAVDLLLEMLEQQKNTKAYKDALFLKSNLHSAKQQYEIKGVIARQEYELIVNKTLLGLENLLEDVEKGPAPESEKPVRKSIVTPTEKNRSSGKILMIGLVVGALIVVLALLYIQRQGEGFMRQEDPLSEVLGRWESGHYEHIYEDLEFLQQHGQPEEQHLAATRLRWLSSVGKRVPVFFIDDFEKAPPNPNWDFWPGENDVGAHRILPTEESHILQLEGHEHAGPTVEMPVSGRREIQFRFRRITEDPTSFHVNLCMGMPDPYDRTTLGFYQEDPVIRASIWEDDQKQKEHQRKLSLKKGQWYLLKIVLTEQEAQVFLDDQAILQFESQRDHLPLANFNIESLSGIIEVDNLLIFGHR